METSFVMTDPVSQSSSPVAEAAAAASTPRHGTGTDGRLAETSVFGIETS
jgi:hypothetical protein